MAGPWEDYASSQSGPWQDYAKPAPTPAAKPEQPPQDMTRFVTGNINKGIAGIVGGTLDTMMNVADLAKAPFGIAYHEATGKPVPRALEPFDRSKYLGTSENTVELMKKGAMVDDNATPRTTGQQWGALGLQMAPSLIPGVPKAAQVAKDAAVKTGQKAVQMAFRPDAQTLELARKAAEYGIPLRPDMLSNNKVVKMMGEALEQVPLAGSKAEDRQVAFNKALIKIIGGDPKASKLTPDVFSSALNQSGSRIGSIYDKTSVRLSPVNQKLDDLVLNASKFETQDNARIIENYVKELKSKAVNEVIPGTALRKLDSAVGRRIRGTPDGDLRSGLQDLQETMRDALSQSLVDPKKDGAALSEARRQYAQALAVEPLVAKSKTGNVSPVGLMGRVTANRDGKARMARGQAGDMGNLARIGQAFIKEPDSSGTAERTLAYGMLGALPTAYSVNPGLAATLYGGANIYNRLGPLLIPPKP